MTQVTGIRLQTAAADSVGINAVNGQERITPQNAPPADIERPEVMTDEELDRMLKEMQQLSSNLGNKLQFSVNKSLGEVVVKVVDPDTDKVIKEIPPVALQKMQIRIKEALGILFDNIV